MNRKVISAIAALCAVAAGLPAFAQAPTTGTIKGRVVFQESGVAVHGASIIVVGTRRESKTGDDGTFEIAAVPAGTYEVLAQREHASTPRQKVVVTAGQTVTIELKMGAAPVHENVAVTASATGTATAFESFNSMISLDSFEIFKKLGATLADTLQDEAGVAKRSFGPGSSRPIIRGFDGDRVLIMQDGLRTGDLSSQSGDHGVSIDPAGLARIEVVKGPATLLFGSNALGGAINAISPQDAFRAQPFDGTVGGANFDTGSANAQAGVAGNVQLGRGPWFAHGSFTSRRTGNYDSPDGTVPNSGTNLVTGEAGLGWTGTRAYVGVSGGGEGNRYGIPYAGLFEGDEDIEIDIKARRQNLRFDTGLRNLQGSFADALRVKVSLVDYRHDEIETEDGVDVFGTRFTNRVATVRAELEQKHTGRVGGRIGAEFFNRAYEAVGQEALTPPVDQSSFAAFAYEEVRFTKQQIQFGGRFERNSYTSTDPRAFNGFSGSAGWRREFGTDTGLIVNMTASSRAPALEELYNFGPHLGNLLFEVGDPDLQLERSVGVDVSFRRRAGRVTGELSAFVYGISNFVFLDVTDQIEDGLRVAFYSQGDSRFAGVEATGRFEMGERAALDASVSYVQAELTGSGEPLPRIPPFHGRVSLTLPIGPIDVVPDVVFYAAQNRVFRDETPTAAWATFNVSATWQKVVAHATHIITFQGYNLTNTDYRLHTSLIKNLAPEMGRGVKVTYGVRLF